MTAVETLDALRRDLIRGQRYRSEVTLCEWQGQWIGRIDDEDVIASGRGATEEEAAAAVLADYRAIGRSLAGLRPLPGDPPSTSAATGAASNPLHAETASA